jgi:hypothetical protein
MVMLIAMDCAHPMSQYKSATRDDVVRQREQEPIHVFNDFTLREIALKIDTGDEIFLHYTDAGSRPASFDFDLLNGPIITAAQLNRIAQQCNNANAGQAPPTYQVADFGGTLRDIPLPSTKSANDQYVLAYRNTLPTMWQHLC